MSQERPQNSPGLKHEKESYLIRGAIFEVYREMGSGFLEAVYQECLEREFRMRNIPFHSRPEVMLRYKGQQLSQVYIPDFICFGKMVVEIKALQTIIPQHEAQLLNYLKVTQMSLGFLVNFGSHPKVDIKRMVL